MRNKHDNKPAKIRRIPVRSRNLWPKNADADSLRVMCDEHAEPTIRKASEQSPVRNELEQKLVALKI